MAQPPKIVIPGLNRGAGVPPGYVLGRLPGTGHGPAQLLNLNALRKVGLATASGATQSTSQAISIAHSETLSLSSAVSSSISSVVSTNVGQSTSLSQISSSLSGAISSTSSLSTAVSTVISGSISTVNSRIDSLSAAIGGGGTIAVQDEGTPIGTFATLNFSGTGVAATDAGGGVALIDIAGGGGGAGTSTSLSQISSSLSSEISSRISGDSSLSTVISSSISTEVSSRTSGDTSLSTAISTVDSNQSSSISANLSKINSLSTAIAASSFPYEALPTATPDLSTFTTWRNQGTASITADSHGVYFTGDNDNELHIYEVNMLSQPFSYYARIKLQQYSTAVVTAQLYMQAGFCVVNSTNGRVLTAPCQYERISGDENNTYVMGIDRWSSVTAVNANPVVVNHTAPYSWLRIDVTSTGIEVFGSVDGWAPWTSIGTEAYATYLTATGGTADKFGIFCRSVSNGTSTVFKFSVLQSTAP